MVVDMETKDGLKRRAVMVVAKKIGLACADLLYYRTNNIHFLLCTSMILIYNSELGNRILSKVQKSFCSCTHVNSCRKYALYINLHILLNI